jgi:hypothetical protein
MTREEVRLLKVGDIVWFLCVDEEPGTATKAVVTKRADDCDVVTIKCVDNPKCEGHRPWHDNIHKTEVEVYEKAISRAESSIEDSEQSIKNYQEDIKQKKANIENLKEKLAKARAEAERTAWVICNEEVVQIFAHDKTFSNVPKYATQEEAYEALADYYKEEFIEASVKGTGGYYAVSREVIVFLPKTWYPSNPKATFDRMGVDMNGQTWRFFDKALFRSREEAEKFLKEKAEKDLEAATRRQV